MGIRDRVRDAVDALRGRFEGRALATMTPTWQTNQAQYPEVSFENMVRFGLRKNELIFACIQATSQAASQVHLAAVDDEGEEIEGHPLTELLARPNSYMNEFDLWAAVIIYQYLAGRALFEKERNNGGRVIALHPLRPDWVKPVPGRNTPIAYYEYKPPGLPPAQLDPEDVLDFKLFDPLNMYNSWPPVAVASRVADVDNAATDFLRLFWDKGGTPPGLLKTKQKLVDADVANIRRRWAERYGGYEKWTEPAVLDMDAEYQATGSSFKDMEFGNLDKRSEVRICMVMEVPPMIVGATIGLERSIQGNAIEFRRGWWEDKLIPRFKNMQDTVQNQLASEFGDVATEWDFSEVPALRESQDALWTRVQGAVTGGFMTVNDARRQLGLEEIGPAGDVFLRGLAVTEVPMKTVRRSTEDSKTERKAEDPPDDEERREIEKSMQADVEAFLDEQLGRIVSGAQELPAVTT